MGPQKATGGQPADPPVPRESWFSIKALLQWAAFALVIYLGFVVVGYNRDAAPAGAPMSEQGLPDEEYLTTQIIQSAIDTSVQRREALIKQSNGGQQPPGGTAALAGVTPFRYTRDAHAKGHGCVLATFHVNDNLQPQFQYGVFRNPGQTFDAIIRYSNGNPSIQADSERDPRGMAIKLRNVMETPKLMPGEENDTTQDFIMMNNPVFFIRTLQEYAELNHLLTTLPNGLLPITWAYFLQRSLNPLHWHLRELKLGTEASHGMPDSLVTERYWSASAYTLGPKQFIKFSAIPCRGNQPKAKGLKQSDPDYLRRELQAQSKDGGACFDFAVQPQVLGKNMPVEDTTVEWSESDSPFTPVARINIKAEDNTSAAMYEQCENTAFNPWHSLPDHRPVGVMNRVRKALYAAMSRFRQDMNCKDNCDKKCDPYHWPDSACGGVPKPVFPPDTASQK